MTGYQYQPLAPLNIRVLHLEAGNSPIVKARLEHVKLGRRLIGYRYDALSYCWGSEADKPTIHVNNAELCVTPNLYNALLRLRNVPSKLPIWIDAICINQASVDEKPSQLKIMPLIYSNARRVIIWLGEQSYDTAAAVDAINTFGKTRKESLRLEQARKFSSEVKEGLADLLTRPWFARLWVLQEAALARERVLLCGGFSLQWEELKAVAATLHKNTLDSPYLERDDDNFFGTGFTELVNTDHCRDTKRATFVADLLLICRQRQCSDPKDRIHAIMGLMERWDNGRADGHLAGTLADLQLKDLYVKFTGCCMDNYGTILSLSDTEKRNPDLPSWCPDYHQTNAAKMSILVESGQYHAGYGLRDHRLQFSWSPANPYQFVLEECAIACRIDRVIDGQWQPLDDREALRNAAAENARWFRACNESALQARGRRSTSNTILLKGEDDLKIAASEVWRTLSADQIDDRHAVVADNAKKYHAFLMLLDGIAQNHSESQSTREDLEFIFRHLNRICLRRRFLATADGRVGLGPERMKTGDFVCIARGATVPFVLRPRNSADRTVTYEFLGVTYVLGIMYGEAVGGAAWQPTVLI